MNAHRIALASLLAASALLRPTRAPAEPDAAQVATAGSPSAPTQSAAAVPASTEAVRVVEKLHGTLLGVMKDAKTLGYPGRYDRLAPVVKELFDLPFMAEKSVGRHWKAAGAENQRELVATFSRFTVANFAGRFDGYTGQAVRTVGIEPSTHGTVLVRTHLDEPKGEGVELNYRLRPVDGGWRIVDIYLNGTVSELALRRSEYSALIQREGFRALLGKLDERIESLAAPGAGQS